MGFFCLQVLVTQLTMVCLTKGLMILVQVSHCPSTVDTWQSHSLEYRCDPKYNESYHCLRGASGDLMEGCITKKFITGKEGCPWVDVPPGSDMQLIWGTPHVECNNKGCPTVRDAYNSDELYRFPKCTEKPNKPPRVKTSYQPRRTNVHFHTIDWDSIQAAFGTTTAVNENEHYKPSLLMFLIPSLSFPIFLMCTICWCICCCGKEKQDTTKEVNAPYQRGKGDKKPIKGHVKRCPMICCCICCNGKKEQSIAKEKDKSSKEEWEKDSPVIEVDASFLSEKGNKEPIKGLHKWSVFLHGYNDLENEIV